jgi:hypothetical protein
MKADILDDSGRVRVMSIETRSPRNKEVSDVRSAPLANPRRTRIDHWPPRPPESEAPEDRERADRPCEEEEPARAA